MRYLVKPSAHRVQMKDAQLFSHIPMDYLRDNQHRPGLESMVGSRLAETYGNDVTLLAFTGTADDFSGKAFDKLNKGWPQLLKDASDSHKVDVSDHTGGTHSPSPNELEHLFGNWKQIHWH